MRQWMLRLHSYAGLLCAPYLILFGISSINFNHHRVPDRASWPVRKWEQSVPVPKTTDDLQTAQAVRDSLGMIGWTPWWLLKRDEAGNLDFEVTHPGKNYKIRLLAAEGKVLVEERSKGLLSIVNALHGMMSVPNSRIATLWGIYTDVCTATVVFAATSGLYLWMKSRRERLVGWLTLAGSLGVSAALMVYIVVRG